MFFQIEKKNEKKNNKHIQTIFPQYFRIHRMIITCKTNKINSFFGNLLNCLNKNQED